MEWLRDSKWFLVSIVISVFLGLLAYPLLTKAVISDAKRMKTPSQVVVTQDAVRETVARPTHRCSMCTEPPFDCGEPGWIRCSRCDGTGDIYDRRLDHHKTCTLCLGLGRRICFECGGTGRR